MRRKEQYVGRRAVEMKVQGRSPKRRWLELDRVKDDIKEKGLWGEEVYDCATWRRILYMSSSIDPT